jgi:geranylgeranyl transferase type-2 subunit beta
MAGYLEQLTVRLADGVGRLPEVTRERHARYVLAAQRGDGGFGGREGGSDLYYTGFALRALSILGELHGETAERAAGFLRGRLSGRESIIDFLSLVYGAMLLDSSAGINVFAQAAPDWREAVSGALEALRRPDGGYAKGTEGAASSTYHSFLVLLCRQLIDRPLPQPDRLVDFILSQRADEGGFREIKASKRAGTNPTAAAIAALRILKAVDADVCEDTVAFLAEMQNDEGGLRANTRIPIADLLSTFTGCLTLFDLDAGSQIDRGAVARFVQAMQCEPGGFRGGELDPGHDVEYTFYGVGCLALLARTNP